MRYVITAITPTAAAKETVARSSKVGVTDRTMKARGRPSKAASVVRTHTLSHDGFVRCS